jgi:hypothetical protein
MRRGEHASSAPRGDGERLATPKSRAASANANLDVRSTPEKVERGGQPQRFSIASTCLAAASPLEPTQECCLAVRRVPELPSHDASTMPHRILVWSGIPQIHVPAESINRLAAHAAKPWTQAVGSFSVRASKKTRLMTYAVVSGGLCCAARSHSGRWA